MTAFFAEIWTTQPHTRDDLHAPGAPPATVRKNLATPPPARPLGPPMICGLDRRTWRRLSSPVCARVPRISASVSRMIRKSQNFCVDSTLCILSRSCFQRFPVGRLHAMSRAEQPEADVADCLRRTSCQRGIVAQMGCDYPKHFRFLLCVSHLRTFSHLAYGVSRS